MVAIAVAAPAAPASAATAGRDGRIAFARFYPDSRTSSIFTIRPDGTGLLRLTRGHWDENPAWSPDGTRIAFSRDGDIWIMGARGRHIHRVTTSPTVEGDPAWSPDGSTLAFTSNRAGDGAVNIYELRSTKPYGRAVAITRYQRSPLCGYQGDDSPTFGPDGSLWWAETGCPPPDYEYETDILHLPVGATEPTRFAQWTGRDLDISPSGTSLLAAASERYSAWLERFDIATGASLFLTGTGEDDETGDPRWAPSGGSIAYVESAYDDATASWVDTLQIMSADASHTRAVVSDVDPGSGISWQAR